MTRTHSVTLNVDTLRRIEMTMLTAFEILNMTCGRKESARKLLRGARASESLLDINHVIDSSASHNFQLRRNGLFFGREVDFHLYARLACVPNILHRDLRSNSTASNMQPSNNPFCVPHLTISEPGPLCPWHKATHLDYYVDVDNTLVAFEKFRNILETPDGDINRNRGLPVLVHGENGCGKTALVHRCAHAIKLKIGAKESALAIVDMSNEAPSGETALRRCEYVLHTIMREIRDLSGFLTEDAEKKFAISSLGSSEADLEQSLRVRTDELSGYLRRADHRIIVMPPRIDLELDLNHCMNLFAKRGIALLLESSEPAFGGYVQRWNATPNQKRIIGLEVGPLKPIDGRSFVEARIRRWAELAETNIEFDPAGIDKYMEMRGPGISVREFELACIRAYEVAAGRHPIGYDDFAAAWVRHGMGFR